MGWWKNLLLIIFNYYYFLKNEYYIHFLKNNLSSINYYKVIQILLLKACSSVDRASDSDSESQGFDSLHAYGLT